MTLKYWGKTIDDYSAMRGPCPEGYHIPLKEEWSAVHDIWIALGWWANDWTNFWAVLKMPFTGYRANLTSNVTGQNSYGHYWSSTAHTSSSQAYSFILYPGTIYRASTNVRCYWESIRPFKDEPVIPDSSWTTLYTSDIYPAVRNIKWSSSLWLITITYEWTYITIADKNLWATQVRNSWDTLSEANCGKYYQRWNNYWFAWTWTLANTSTTQVDASTYWPWNYYSSNTFIKYSWARDSSDNRNLWWWVTWIKHNPVYIVDRYYWGKTIQDYSAMRGPCPEGFHIPTYNEHVSLINIMQTFEIPYSTDYEFYLHMPFRWWMRKREDGSVDYTTQSSYWTCSESSNAWYAWHLTGSTGGAVPVNNNGYGRRAGWKHIRPFKDEPVIPTSSRTTIYEWGAWWDWTNWYTPWIFWDQTNWLISISSNWKTTDSSVWITITDKNLWATTIYNSWDTASEANCWKFYQWGNNYWFPFTWSITTSSTRVDASSYWPWNYYSSSTFITNSTNPADWSSVQNGNLRWWVTWVQQKPAKVTEVYYNTTKIWPAYPAWVYWNQSLWLISASSNWTDWVTITDKNLWATVVYNQWDTMSESNCWKFYQRWNNYWFSFTWTPSRTLTKVNVSSYWPSNYYSSSTFVRVNWDWRWWTDGSATAALNLWWDITDTNEARRWPCPEWFHIPSHTEGLTLMDIPRTLQRLTWDAKRAVYKIPKCWFRDNYSSQVVDTWNDWAMWTTTQEATDFWWTMPSAWFWPAWWLNIRPFRNTAIIPTDEWVKLL